jgi:hypothetical protein
MNSSASMAKIEMIERSMSCFMLGLFALLPVIGIPMAVMALAQYRRVKLGQGAMWNPAHRYLFWGVLCARLGLWPIVIAAVLFTAAVYLSR